MVPVLRIGMHCVHGGRNFFVISSLVWKYEQPDVAASLNRACAALKDNILNPDNVSQLTGRLKRRVVLD